MSRKARLKGVLRLTRSSSDQWQAEVHGSELVGYSRWESKQALLDTGVSFGSDDEVPDGELRPRRRYFLSDFLEDEA